MYLRYQNYVWIITESDLEGMRQKRQRKEEGTEEGKEKAREKIMASTK